VEWPGKEGKEPVRAVEVWQIYIKGRKPTALPGARDEAISLSGGTIPQTAAPYPAKVGAELRLE